MDNTPSIHPPVKRSLSARACIAIGLGVFALTIALLYLQENARGNFAWNAFKRQYEAKGKSLDWQRFIPPSVPDDQNMLKAPGMGGFVKGQPSGSITLAIDQVNENARKFEVKNVLVATFHLIGDKESAPPGMRLIESFDEAADTIDSQGQVLDAPAGGMVCHGSFLTGQPLNLALRGLTNSILKELQNRISKFTVRATSASTLGVYLDSGIPAEQYIKAYESQKTHFDELAAALKRPYSRMDGDYSNPAFIPIPNFVALRTLAQTLGQTAQSYLLLGRPNDALQALTLMHASERLFNSDPAKKCPTLVAAMINVAIKGLYVQMIADGQRLGAWREPQMAALQKQLEQVDLLPLVRQSMDFEVLAVTTTCQMRPILDVFETSNVINGKAKWFNRSLSKLIPRGWILQNMVRYGQIMERQNTAFSSGSPGVVPSAVDAMAHHLETELANPSLYSYLARMAIPNYPKAIQTGSKIQTLADLASISLALERSRLATGKYPATLETLRPTYLSSIPRDLITGEPPIYRLSETGAYRLYSVGWNEKNDNGVEGGSVTEGDWVWNPANK